MQHRADFDAWQSFDANHKIMPTLAKTKVVLAKPAPLYLHKGDRSYLVGYGTEFSLQGEFDAFQAGAAGSATGVTASPYKSDEPSLTNINKMPGYSAETQAVMLALRELKREQRAALAAMRAASIAARPGDNPAPQPDPVPEPEPQPEPDATA